VTVSPWQRFLVTAGRGPTAALRHTVSDTFVLLAGW